MSEYYRDGKSLFFSFGALRKSYLLMSQFYWKTLSGRLTQTFYENNMINLSRKIFSTGTKRYSSKYYVEVFPPSSQEYEKKKAHQYIILSKRPQQELRYVQD